MSELNTTLRDFLLRNLHNLKYRRFLINILTVTANRPVLFLDPAYIVTAMTGKLTDTDVNSLKVSVKPNLQSDKSIDPSKLNPLNKWVYENDIPIIQSCATQLDLVRQIQNFVTFSEGDQAKANAFSEKVRNITCTDYINYLLDTDLKEDQNEIITVVNNKTGKQYVAEFRSTADDIKAGIFQLCILSDDVNKRLMTEVDTLSVTKSDIINVVEPIVTTVGRVIVNQLFLVDPFGDTFPFFNDPVNLNNGDIIDMVKVATIDKKVTVEQYKKHLDGVYYLGHFTELCTPCLNERAMTTDPNIAKRKAELYKQYAGQLDDPLIIAKIEDELIAMDKAWMKGDTSMRFYETHGGKSFDLWRKKLYIAVGGIEAFDKDASKYDFIPNSLEEGMTLQDLPKYGNESRKGSYQRGHETRNGGALTKYIIRAFHDSRVVEDDCGTDRGIMVNFNEVDIKKYKGRYINLNGKWTEITDDNINKIPIKSYLMRSPQYCQCTKGGYCYKCVGKLFANMNVQQLTMNVVDISTTFMNAAMKNMHGSKLALNEIKSLDHYVL